MLLAILWELLVLYFWWWVICIIGGIFAPVVLLVCVWLERRAKVQ